MEVKYLCTLGWLTWNFLSVERDISLVHTHRRRFENDVQNSNLNRSHLVWNEVTGGVTDADLHNSFARLTNNN